MSTKTYTYEEAQKAALEYYKGDELAADVLISKYALKDSSGNVYETTPVDIQRRLAREFARIEKKYPNPMSEEEIFELFSDWTVCPQGGPMAGIGNKFQVQSLSNCFVVDSPYDSYGGIMRTDEQLAQIMKRRGGCGVDISPLRPKDLPTKNAAMTTDGISLFMQRYSNTTHEVAQEGRRGALMLSVCCHHPDVLAFANIKRDKNLVTKANVSIKFTDEFLQAVEKGEKYQQRWPVEKDVPHVVEKWVDAKEVYMNIMSATRDCSEPGAFFWDTVLRMSPADCYADVGFRTRSTNPCGELPLSTEDSCRLLFVNYTKFVKNPFTDQAQFDHERFAIVVQKAQRLMDDLVDLELEAIDAIIKKVGSDPEPEDVKQVELNLWKKVYKTAQDGRRTGLGITALGDLIAYMNLKYGSPESVALTEEVYRALAINSYKSSVQMAKERGTFPVYDYYKECNNPFIVRIMEACPELKHDYMRYGRRNIGNLTTAPVGSLSLLTQTTSGCEPMLWLKARRKRKLSTTDKMGRVDEVDAQGDRWQYYNVYHPGFKKWMEVTGKTVETESPYFGSSIEDIDPFTKVDIQAAAQKWVDHSISNTLNMPKDVTAETVSQLFMKAWKTGCKGMTVYRISSRDAVIVKEGGEEDKKKENAIVKRPKELPCDIHRSNIGGQQYVVLVGLFDGKPYEIFAGLQESIEIPKKAKRGILIKNGKDTNGNTTYNLKIMIDEDDYMMIKDVVTQFDNPTYGAFTRTISYLLRLGTPIVDIVEQLRKDKNSNITSFSSCIARVLAKGYIKDGSSAGGVCPSCGSKELRYIEACATCMSCGQSKCS